MHCHMCLLHSRDSLYPLSFSHVVGSHSWATFGLQQSNFFFQTLVLMFLHLPLLHLVTHSWRAGHSADLGSHQESSWGEKNLILQPQNFWDKMSPRHLSTTHLSTFGCSSHYRNDTLQYSPTATFFAHLKTKSLSWTPSRPQNSSSLQPLLGPGPLQMVSLLSGWEYRWV